MDNSKESLLLAEEILKNIELQELPLSSIVLRCARLARITQNQEAIDLFRYELAGYPKNEENLVYADAFSLARKANRTFFEKDKVTSKNQEFMFVESASQLENELQTAQEQMKVSQDGSISIHSSNPNQWIQNPAGNTAERQSLRQSIIEKSGKIDKLKWAYYNYVLGVLYELKFKKIKEDIFQKKKLLSDKALSEFLPASFEKFVSVYQNLESENPEDWANAVHSCRRILKDVADFLYPPSDKEITIEEGVEKRKLKLNKENYIIRIKQFIKEKSSSETFSRIFWSHLEFIGDRIDSIYKSSTKWSHDRVERSEAESYVVYTYMLIADLMELFQSEEDG